MRGRWLQAVLVALATLGLVQPHEAWGRVLVPVLECVEHDAPGPGQYTARWGYRNNSSQVLMVPAVPGQNAFEPRPYDMGQPTFFQPGRQRTVFTTVFGGSSVRWSLKGPDGITSTATATTHPWLECPVCGDELIGVGETCDDGNAVAGDGCSAQCQVEPGWSCASCPSVCTPSCGDGLVTGAEGCDDGNVVAGDGCSATCRVESGWTCGGAPSVCTPSCGDGVLSGNEDCDDGNILAGDGCSDTCSVEPGWSCSGIPSLCEESCGDGLVTGGEQCDDANAAGGDGCSASCMVEPGWTCSDAPSQCILTCGDGQLSGNEQCDDGNTLNGDGCSTTCQVDPGWICTGVPSVCATACGDGIVSGAEACDDGNVAGGDGCDTACQIEPGFSCVGSPSICTALCGDGLVSGAEQCDDGNLASGDGCSGACRSEPGWTCTGAPSVCATTCGDGIPAGLEDCDDGNLLAGDGCSPSCAVESGWSCAGIPSACSATCGDGLRVGTEQCDDGNLVSGDCCSSSCTLEPAGSACASDGNVCTDDVCNGAGLCTHPPNTAPCDDGDACTLNDACLAGVCEPGAPKNCSDGNPCTADICTGGVCSNPPFSEPAPADFVFVIDASASMRSKLRTWIAEQLGGFPDALTEAGVDWRIAIVRYGTFQNPKKGPLVPDLFLDWTTDADLFRAAIPELGRSIRRPTEAALEGFDLALDRLTFRPEATPTIILYTDEDDDAPALSTERREPPARGPACIGRAACEDRWLAVQARIDAMVERLVPRQVRLNLVMAPRERPSIFQYGDPSCSVLMPDGRLDLASTLQCLQNRGADRSLQGQLLGAGRCEASLCSTGLIGSPCVVDSDCSLLARAYQVPRVRRQGAEFFPALLRDTIAELTCELP